MRTPQGGTGQNGKLDLPAGRRPATPEPSSDADTTQEHRGRKRGEVTHRTPPSSPAVGRLLRRLGQHGIPQVDYAELGRVERSQWRDHKRTTIIVNTSYPLYEEGSDPYIAETILLHMLSEDDVFVKAPISRTLEELDRVLWAWEEERE